MQISYGFLELSNQQDSVPVRGRPLGISGDADMAQAEFEEAMKGIFCDTDTRVKDEAPQAYKNLAQVMKNQAELTEVVHHLKPLVNVKGFT